MENDIMLTTADNPYDPFTQFDDWYAYDENAGYHTCAYLARVAKVSEDFSDLDEFEAIEAAMNEIVEFDIYGVYKKVSQKRVVH